MTDDLVAFLRARLDEDEQVAQTASEKASAPWQTGVGGDDWTRERMLFDGLGGALWENEGSQGMSLPEGVAPHIARWDPARVLAEVQAKRRMIDHLELAMPRLTPLNNWGAAEMDELAGNMLQLLALPYAAHPDYRAEWSPEWWPYGEGNDA